MDNNLLPEVTTFLIERVLINSTGEYNKEERERLHFLTREKVMKLSLTHLSLT